MTKDITIDLEPVASNALVIYAIKSLIEQTETSAEILHNPQLEECLATLDISPYYNRLLAIGLGKALKDYINDQE
jgi:hypothetical protein